MTTTKIKAKPKTTLALLRDHYTPYADTVSVKNGVYTLRRGFFYRLGKTENDLAADLKANFPKAKIIDKGDVWKDFSGGAPMHRQSHWWVTFTLEAN